MRTFSNAIVDYGKSCLQRLLGRYLYLCICCSIAPIVLDLPTFVLPSRHEGGVLGAIIDNDERAANTGELGGELPVRSVALAFLALPSPRVPRGLCVFPLLTILSLRF